MLVPDLSCIMRSIAYPAWNSYRYDKNDPLV